MKNFNQHQSRYDNEMPPEIPDEEVINEEPQERNLSHMDRRQIELCDNFDYGFGGID